MVSHWHFGCRIWDFGGATPKSDIKNLKYTEGVFAAASEISGAYKILFTPYLLQNIKNNAPYLLHVFLYLPLICYPLKMGYDILSQNRSIAV